MSAALRISLGIVMLTTTLLFFADWILDIFPDPYAPAVQSRQDLSESLAIQYSSLVSADRLPDMQLAMELVVSQKEDVLSMRLKMQDGSILGATRNHAELWTEKSSFESSPKQVLVPIFQGQKQWGTLEVKFDALPNSGFLGLLSTPLYKLIGLMAFAGFFSYLIYLSRTLRYLDPSSVVPDRVKAALDQLVEGVFILDNEQQIVLVNSSFSQHIGTSENTLIGANPDTFTWLDNNNTDEMPWTQSIRQGIRKTDIRLELKSKDGSVRAFRTNVSPITDDSGKNMGVLASFHDVSELEEANEGLKSTLENLEKAHNDVRTKNIELLQLASVDSLTDCLNRRVFFEKLNQEIMLAKRENFVSSVVMADIDNFKDINDTYGHAVGDMIIKDFATTLKDIMGGNGFVGRYGGEEFAIVLAGVDENTSVKLSNEARSRFQSMHQSENSVTNGNAVTASFGVSTTESNFKTVEELLNFADLALYESKKRGRDRVTSWSSLDSKTDRAA